MFTQTYMYIVITL